MPKGRVLSKEEQEQILKLHDAGASGREIAKKIQRSKTVVLNYLRNPSQYAQVKRAGRKRLLSAEEEQRLFLAIFRTNMTPLETPAVTLSTTPASSSLVAVDGGAAIATAAADTHAVAVAAAAAAAATATATAVVIENETPSADSAPAASVSLTDRSTPRSSGMIQMSAAQIKKEFNVPLSTRRIQQLLCKWRHQARKEKDKQHALMTSADALLTVAKSNSTTSASGSVSTDAFVSTSISVTSTVTSTMPMTLLPEKMATPQSSAVAPVPTVPPSLALDQSIESSMQQSSGNLFDRSVPSEMMSSSLSLALAPTTDEETSSKPQETLETQVV